MWKISSSSIGMWTFSRRNFALDLQRKQFKVDQEEAEKEWQNSQSQAHRWWWSRKSETVSVMHQLIWEVGRFYQQQRQNLRQFLDILVEVDIRRSEAKEHVKNETVHTDAILLPELAFDASRILEQAITILKKYAGIDLFPCAFKERRRFFGHFYAFLAIRKLWWDIHWDHNCLRKLPHWPHG